MDNNFSLLKRRFRQDPGSAFNLQLLRRRLGFLPIQIIKTNKIINETHPKYDKTISETGHWNKNYTYSALGATNNRTWTTVIDFNQKPHVPGTLPRCKTISRT